LRGNIAASLASKTIVRFAVTLSIANHHSSLPVAYRLYLPKEWATDRQRRRKAGVPKEVTFKTKPAIALEQLRWAGVAGVATKFMVGVLNMSQMCKLLSSEHFSVDGTLIEAWAA
jgi:SRSO17 transposase